MNHELLLTNDIGDIGFVALDLGFPLENFDTEDGSNDLDLYTDPSISLLEAKRDLLGGRGL